MPDWGKLLEEVRGLKPENAPKGNPNATEEEKPLETTVPERHWWQIADILSRNDELLQAILEQLQTMGAVTAPTIPAPPPDYDVPVIPPGLEPAMKVTAEEQVRTRQLLEGFKFITNQSVVSTPGTPTEVVSTVKTYLLVIRSHTTNTGNVYIGGTGVTTATGYIMGAGEALVMQIDNLKKSVWVDADVAGEGVSWMALVD